MTPKQFNNLWDKVRRAQKSTEIALSYLRKVATDEEIEKCGDSLAQINCAAACLESFFENLDEIEVCNK